MSDDGFGGFDGFSGVSDLGGDRSDALDVDVPLHTEVGANWRFVPCLDTPGEILLNVGPGLSSAELKEEVLKHREEGARSVNTNGEIKSFVDAPQSWQRFTDDRTQGMWILLDGVTEDAPSGVSDTMGHDMAAMARSGSPFLGQGANAPGVVGGFDRSDFQEGNYTFDRHVAMAPSELMSAHGGPAHNPPGDKPPTRPSITANKKNWANNTMEKLKQAKDLNKQAVKSILANEEAHGHAQRFNVQKDVVTHTIKKKIGRSQDLSKALEDRIESVEDTIRQAGESLFQLQRAHRCKWGPLNVCERRLELRDTRPPQELVVDHCQEALEIERKCLIEARAGLSLQMEKMRETLIGLDALKGELCEDLQHKRHALRIDRSCLSPRKPPGKPKMASSAGLSNSDRLVLPSLQDIAHYGLPSSPKNSESGTGHQNEESRREGTEKLIMRAVKREEDAVSAANDSDALIMQTQRDCQKSSAKTQSELTRRVDELQTIRKHLEVQMKQTDETIAATEMSTAKTKQTLESHDKPLRALDKQFAARGRRTSREGIRDLVHDEMEGHLDTLKKSVKALTDKLQASKDILEQLRASKSHMQEDYRNKLLAQKVDDACIKVTPKKSMELDRMDPRGGRCAATPRKKRGYVHHPLEIGFMEQVM